MKKQEKRDVLYRFYTVLLDDLEIKDLEIIKKIESLYFGNKYDKYESVNGDFFLRDFEGLYKSGNLDLTVVNSAFEQIKDSKNKYGQKYDNIVLCYENVHGNMFYARIEGIYQESDEEFEERKSKQKKRIK